MRYKNILVTGAAGFIGYNLCNKLISQGLQVTGIDNLNDYYDLTLKIERLKKLGISKISKDGSSSKNFNFFKIDLNEKNKISEIVANYKIDVIVNLAAQAGVRYSIENPEAYLHSNCNGFASILEVARENDIKNLIYASTSSVYGLNTKMPLSEDMPTEHPMALYAATKKGNEMMAHAYSHLFGIPTTGLRFFTVYGPWGRPDMALFLFTEAILKEKPINIFNNGEMIRDFTFVEDITESISRLIDKPAETDKNWSSDDPDISTSSAPYRIFNIGNGNPTNLMDYIEEIESSLGKKALKNFMPMQAGDVPATHANSSRLQEYIGFYPKTSIKDGIREFINWYKEYYNVNI